MRLTTVIITLLASCASLWGQGATIPVATWTNSTVAGGNKSGYTFSMIGFDAITYVANRAAICGWSEAPPGSFSEQQDAIYCFRFEDNRTFPLLINSGFKSTHTSPQGHSNQVFSYSSDHGSIFWDTDGSYGNIQQNYVGFWQFDTAGLVGIDKPLQKIGGVYTRPWQPSSTPQNGSVYDNFNHRLVYWYNYNFSSGSPSPASVCDPTGGTCSASSTTNAPNGNVTGSVAAAFNTVDHKTYWYIGGNANLYTYDVAANAWALLSTTCSGGTCSGNAPPVRQGAGFAWSTVDHLFLMMGGFNGATTYTDSWSFEPVTRVWTQLCTSCGYPGSGSGVNRPGNRLAFDISNNVFAYFSDATSAVWLYAMSAPTGNLGRTAASFAPPTTSLNRTSPPSSPSNSIVQGWATDIHTSFNGTDMNISWAETSPTTNNSNCWSLVPQVLSVTSGYLPAGSVNTNCTAFGILGAPRVEPTGHTVSANVNGTQWSAYSLTNNGGGSTSQATYAASYSSGTWSPLQVGCFTASCTGNTNVTSSPASMIAVGSTPTLATIEEVKNVYATHEDYLWVSQWNGSSWVSVGGAKLNNYVAGSGTYMVSAYLATDGGGTNMAACWAEQKNDPSNHSGLLNTPQIFCKTWNGTSWSVLGSSASPPTLSQSSASWSYDPTVVYANGYYYVAYTETTQTGVPKVYVLQCIGASCTTIGSVLNSNTTTGRAYHAHVSTDGTLVYVAWEEQSDLGQPTRGYVKYWTGKYWQQIGGALFADSAGSVNDISCGVLSARPSCAWLEQTFGNMKQVYKAQWDGSTWTQTYGSNSSFSVAATVKAATYPGSPSGVTVSNAPYQVGMPIPNSAGITSVNSLAMSNSTQCNFMVTGSWANTGNIKWVKSRCTVGSFTGGSTASVTLSNSGSGPFGGSNLASDNGNTITVNTGAAIATISKTNFRVLDAFTVGSTVIITGSASDGLVAWGPSVPGSYPDNVVCSNDGLNHAGVSSACTNPYKSANDSSSTAFIEENGPAAAVIRATGSLKDNSGNVYRKYDIRMYFYKALSQIKIQPVLKNAEYASSGSNVFNNAYMGYQGWEIRLTTNLTGTLSYTIANHTGTPSTGTLNGSGGTDYAYLYQAESSNLSYGSWCQQRDSWRWCVLGSTLNGYTIIANGSQVTSGSVTQYPTGWADIRDASGLGVEIGQYQLAAYSNKSLEFRNGGSTIVIGMKAIENNSTSLTTLYPSSTPTPYYLAYPQYELDDVWLNFHETALSSPNNDFLSYQQYLIGAASVTAYNADSFLAFPLLDSATEDSWYSATTSSAVPAVPTFTFQDLGTTNTSQFPLHIWRYYIVSIGSSSNQMEFRYSHDLNFIRRGFTGNFLDSDHHYRLQIQLWFPRANGFSWTSHGGDTSYFDYYNPVINGTLKSQFLGTTNWAELSQEHNHWYGMDTHYFITGDENYRDALTTALPDFFLTTGSTNNLISQGKLVNARALGVSMMGPSRLSKFIGSQGDATNSAAILARGTAVFNNQIVNQLCVTDANGVFYPTGCTIATGGNVPPPLNAKGTSTVRGIGYAFTDTSVNSTGCSWSGDRTNAPFMNGNQAQGMWELQQALGTSSSIYNQIYDYGYGITQGNFGEMFADNGTANWNGNGFRYKSGLDFPNSCSAEFIVINPNAYWPLWYTDYNYTGAGRTRWQTEFTQAVQSVLNIASSTNDELYQYTIANNIYLINHPATSVLQTQLITGFVDNGGGSYTITWTVPTGALSYRIKWSTNQITDYIGWNAGTNLPLNSPATYANWFASTDAANIPTPGTPGSSQSITIATGQTGLSAANFMVKAYASLTPPPTVGGSALTKGTMRGGIIR